MFRTINSSLGALYSSKLRGLVIHFCKTSIRGRTYAINIDGHHVVSDSIVMSIA